jgi:hypothetical protein
MPAAEKGAVYVSPLGTFYKILGFASHVTSNEIYVLYSRMQKNGTVHENVLIDSLEHFTGSRFSRAELVR